MFFWSRVWLLIISQAPTFPVADHSIWRPHTSRSAPWSPPRYRFCVPAVPVSAHCSVTEVRILYTVRLHFTLLTQLHFTLLLLMWGFCTLSNFTSHCWLSLMCGFSNFTSHFWLSLRWGFCTLSSWTSHCWLCHWGEDSVHCLTSLHTLLTLSHWAEDYVHCLSELDTTDSVTELRIPYIVQLHTADSHWSEDLVHCLTSLHTADLSLRWRLCTLSNFTSHCWLSLR